MTAVCGWVDPAAAEIASERCHAILLALQQYGGPQRRVRTCHAAAFGTSIFKTVPEDRFDRQPIAVDDGLFTADVRLDNRDELIESLGLDCSDARSHSDGWILSRAW